MRDAGIADAGLLLVHRDRVQGARRGRGAAATSRSASSSRSSSSPPTRAARSACEFARSPADVPPALVAAFSYSQKVMLERHVHGRELAVSILGDEPLPVVEAVPREEDFYDFSARYTIGRTSFVCPAQLGDALTEAAQSLALEVFRLLGCRGFARVDLMLEEGTGELFVLEVNAIPGLTETSLLPEAADAAGIGFDELIGRIVEMALQPA